MNDSAKFKKEQNVKIKKYILKVLLVVVIGCSFIQIPYMLQAGISIKLKLTST